MSLTVDVLTDADRIRARCAQWRELCSGLVADSMFMSWEWLNTVLDCGPVPLQMLVFHERDEDPVALVPMAVQHRRGRLGGPELAFGASSFDWPNRLDFACALGWEEPVANALARWLEDARWAVASFRRFRTASPVLEKLVASARGSFQVCYEVPSNSPSFELPTSMDAFYGGLTKTFRKKLRYKVRRLNREFSVGFEFAGSVEDVDRTFDHLVELHRARVHGRGGVTRLGDHEETMAFHRAFCRNTAASGDLRLSRLLLDGKVAAISYDVRARDTVFMYNVGFDPEFGGYSPGNVLTVLSIERYIAEGVTECNLMVGDEPYKFMWAHQVRRDENVILFPTGLLGSVDRQIHNLRERRRERGLAQEHQLRQEAAADLRSFLRVEWPLASS